MEILKTKNDTTHEMIYHYNTIIKTYANNEKKIKYSTYSNSIGLPNLKKSGGSLSEEEKQYQKYKNLYNTKQNIIDLAYHNGLIKKWEYFVTLTFDDQKVNAKDYISVSEALAKWLDNMKHQNKSMEYILAPEPHKSGRIHFHGIFRNVPKWVLIEARNPKSNRLIKKNGKQIYNLANYKYGYTTISKIDNLEAISVYMSKYMTKDLIDLAYKKRYWSSKSLKRPTIEYAYFNEEQLNFYIDKSKFNVEEHKVEKENFSTTYYAIRS